MPHRGPPVGEVNFATPSARAQGCRENAASEASLRARPHRPLAEPARQKPVRCLAGPWCAVVTPCRLQPVNARCTHCSKLYAGRGAGGRGRPLAADRASPAVVAAVDVELGGRQARSSAGCMQADGGRVRVISEQTVRASRSLREAIAAAASACAPPGSGAAALAGRTRDRLAA